MEAKKLLAAIVKSRVAYEAIREFVGVSAKNNPQYSFLLQQVDNYYKRDPNATSVDRDTFTELVLSQVPNEKSHEVYRIIIANVYGIEVSVGNVVALCNDARRFQLADQMLPMLKSSEADKEKLVAILEEYLALTLNPEQEDTGEDELTGFTIEELLAHEGSGSGEKLQLYPKDLNDRLDGGVGPGDHIIGFARPETGKSLVAVNAACGFVRQNAKTLYITNEDRRGRVAIRCMSNLSGCTKWEMEQDWRAAQEKCDKFNYRGNLVIVDLAPGSIRDIRRLLDKYQPKAVILDQLRNIQAGNKDGRVEELATAARRFRDLMKEYGAVGLSMTQAGDSATNRLVLTASDVDNSKTGIPAACDVLLGIGVNEEFDMLGQRMFSLPKNKLGNDHSSFPVIVETHLSRVRSI